VGDWVVGWVSIVVVVVVDGVLEEPRWSRLVQFEDGRIGKVDG
jgi:hypothetical protein